MCVYIRNNILVLHGKLLPQMVKNCPGRIRSIQGGGGHTAMLLGKVIVLDLGISQIGLCSSNDVEDGCNHS